jgi:hypothetical protein
MNTASSLVLLAMIGGFLVVDAVYFDWDLSFYLARKFLDLLNVAAFWR